MLLTPINLVLTHFSCPSLHTASLQSPTAICFSWLAYFSHSFNLVLLFCANSPECTRIMFSSDANTKKENHRPPAPSNSTCADKVGVKAGPWSSDLVVPDNLFYKQSSSFPRPFVSTSTGSSEIEGIPELSPTDPVDPDDPAYEPPLSFPRPSVSNLHSTTEIGPMSELSPLDSIDPDDPAYTSPQSFRRPSVAASTASGGIQAVTDLSPTDSVDPNDLSYKSSSLRRPSVPTSHGATGIGAIPKLSPIDTTDPDDTSYDPPSHLRYPSISTSNSSGIGNIPEGSPIDPDDPSYKLPSSLRRPSVSFSIGTGGLEGKSGNSSTATDSKDPFPKSFRRLSVSTSTGTDGNQATSGNSPIDPADPNIPTLMLEKLSSGGSRVLRKTLSQASSLSLEPISPILPTASNLAPSAEVNGISSSVSIPLAPTRRQPRPRLLSPIPSTDQIPIYRGSYAQQTISGALGSPPISGKNSISFKSNPGSSNGFWSPKCHSRGGSMGMSLASPGSPHMIANMNQIEKIFSSKDVVRDTFGLEELRDGFFDAVFAPPNLISKLAYQSIKRAAAGDEDEPEEKVSWFGKLKLRASGIFHTLSTDSPGCPPFLKAFIGYAIAYVLCLVWVTGNWLGEYRYFMYMATINHHAGRSSGSQIEITGLTIAGGSLGLACATLALYVSTCTGVAERGYGGILSVFILFILGIQSWYRANFTRLSHGMVSFSIVYICTILFDTAPDSRRWSILWDTPVPYLFGVLISLLVNLLVMPDFGHYNIMSAFLNVLKESKKFVQAVSHCDHEELNEKIDALNHASSALSLSYREMCNEITISTLESKDALTLRNTIQLCVGRLRIIPSPDFLLQGTSAPMSTPASTLLLEGYSEPVKEMMKEIAASLEVCELYMTYLYKPTYDLKSISFTDRLQSKIDKLNALLAQLVKTYRKFLYSETLIDSEWQSQSVIDLLLFVHYLSDACYSVIAILTEFQKLASKKRRWTISFIHYPLFRYLKTSTRQTTHDRGGRSVFFFFQSMNDVEDVFKQLQIANQASSKNYQSLNPNEQRTLLRSQTGFLNNASVSGKFSFRHAVWTMLHRLQQHESRFALRFSTTVLLLSLPAFIHASKDWYAYYDIWIAPVCALLVMHPRVGGSVHDLFTRVFCAVSGALWAAIGFKAGNGNPYVLSVFAALYSK